MLDRFKACLGLFAILISCNTKAALTLTVNTNTETWSLTGSDTGTPQDVGGQGFIEWQLSSIGGSGGPSNSQLNDDTMFTTTSGTPGNGNTGFDTILDAGDNGGGFMTIALGVSTTVSQTITGTGASASYAGFTAGNKTRLEGLDGQSLPLLPGSGTGFSSLAVTVVPEPHTISIASGAALLAFSLWRTRIGLPARK